MSTVNEKMTALADAIRVKAGRTDTLTIDEMITSVQGIQTGEGGDVTIATSVVTITIEGYAGPGVGEGLIYYTNSNGEYVEENIFLQSSGSVTINMAANTLFYTHATEMSDGCHVNGGQKIEENIGGFLCVITDPIATIYLT